MNDNHIKANIIRGHKLAGPLAEGDDDKSMSEVENAEDQDSGRVASNRRKKKDDLQSDFLKWKTARSLLPTEVCSFPFSDIC